MARARMRPPPAHRVACAYLRVLPLRPAPRARKCSSLLGAPAYPALCRCTPRCTFALRTHSRLSCFSRIHCIISRCSSCFFLHVAPAPCRRPRRRCDRYSNRLWCRRRRTRFSTSTSRRRCSARWSTSTSWSSTRLPQRVLRDCLVGPHAGVLGGQSLQLPKMAMPLVGPCGPSWVRWFEAALRSVGADGSAEVSVLRMVTKPYFDFVDAEEGGAPMSG